MDASLLLEYGWTLIVLVILEGLLAADNALVLAVMVKHLEPEQKKKALFYGLAGAFVFRFLSLFVISFLVDVWQIQAIGALYLLFIALNHLFRKFIVKREEHHTESNGKKSENFWWTVIKVELADIAFAVDSILAAVALAITLPELGTATIGGLNAAQFVIIFLGGVIGLVIMRFAAGFFSKLLLERPGLETTAFLIVGWVGVKLSIITLGHPSIGFISEDFAHGTTWKIIFWVVLIAIASIGWFTSKKESTSLVNNDTSA